MQSLPFARARFCFFLWAGMELTEPAGSARRLIFQPRVIFPLFFSGQLPSECADAAPAFRLSAGL